jgi:hypothetical protein
VYAVPRLTAVIRATAVAAAWLTCAPVAAQQTAPTDRAAAAEVRAELDRLRREFESLRDAYGARLTALEEKLAQIESKPRTLGEAAAAQPVPPVEPLPAAPSPDVQAAAPSSPPAGAQEAAVPSGSAGAGGPQGTLPVYGGTTALSKIFNPDIAVIGNFLGAAGRNDINPAPAFEMHEAEATFQAVVDPYARADFFLAFSPEGVEIEEGFLTFPTLPGGLLAKVGKMKQQVGRVNTLHPHLLPWIDRPLAAENLLGGDEGLSDSGVSVSRLILNPWFFLEATGEVYQGSSGVFTSHSRGDLSYVGRLRGYQDLSESTNIDVGTSFAWGRNELGSDFSTRIVAVDATFRYRPLRRAIYRRFMGRTELFWSRREGLDANASAFGMYASGDYQFARRWFAGARYDWSERADDPSLVDKGASLVLTFWPSEFSQLRGQYRRVRFGEGVTSNEVLFQLLFSIGAHGAHTF